MRVLYVLVLLGVICRFGTQAKENSEVTFSIKYITEDETDGSRANRVRRQSLRDRLKDLFGGGNGDSSEEAEVKPAVEPVFSESEPVLSEFESSNSFSESGSYFEGSGSVPSTTTESPKPVGIAAKEIELTIGTGDETAKMKLAKRKKLKMNTSKKVLRNGKLVVDDSKPSCEEVGSFEDVSNGTGSQLLTCCTVDKCKEMGAILGSTGTSFIESATAQPYKDTPKAPPPPELTMNEERPIGVRSDGTLFNFPVVTRKKRDLLLTPKMKESMRQRRRRQASASNVVELVIVVDYSEYLYWLERSSHDADSAKTAMQLYFMLIANMLDLRFKDLYNQTGDEVTFMINDVIFADIPSDSAFIEDNIVDGVVDVNKALDDFTIQMAPVKGQMAPHDHIMLITKRDLGSLKNGVMNSDTLGVAWTGGMCSQFYSISIIEDPGHGLIDYVAAHEIGHSMNSIHDSELGCSDDDFYIMGAKGGAPVEGLASQNKASHPFLFSPCAANNIHDFITNLGSGSCMQDNSYDTEIYDNYKSFFAPGVILPIDTQCEFVYGNGSRRCYALEQTLCSDGAWCWNPADPNYCYSLYVREGTLCAENKRCHMGVCEDSTLVVPTCPPEVYASLNAQKASNGPVVVDTGGNVADFSITVAPSTGTSYATYQSVVTQAIESADVIC